MHAYVTTFLLLDALFIHSIISVGSHHGCGYRFNQSVQWPNHDTIEVKNNYKCRNEFVISDGAIIQAYGFNEKCISENNMGLCIMEGQMVFKLPL